MASISPIPKLQFFNGGETLSGGKLYTYLSGTTTPYPTYTTAAADVEHTNPIILDSRGEATVYLDQAVQYRYDLYDANDEPVWDAPRDGINPLPDPIQPSGFYVPNFGPDSDQRSVDNRLQDSVHIRDFTLVCDGVTDEWLKFYDALTWCIANNRSLKMYGNCYLGSGSRTWPAAVAGQMVRIWSDGDAIISADGNYFMDNLVGSDLNLKFEKITFNPPSVIPLMRFADTSRFDNAQFVECNFNGVGLSGGLGGTIGASSTNLLVDGCTFDRWEFKVYSPNSASDNVKFTRNVFKNGVIALSLGGFTNYIIENNEFTDLTESGILYEDPTGLVISGNRFLRVGNGTSAVAIRQNAGSIADGVSITGNTITGDPTNTAKAMIVWDATTNAISSGNYCNTTLHSFAATTNVAMMGDRGAVATVVSGTGAVNEIRGDQGVMLDINSSNTNSTEFLLRNTSANGIPVMRWQTATTGYTITDGFQILNETGSPDISIDNQETTGKIKLKTGSTDNLILGPSSSVETAVVTSPNATSTELILRNTGGSAGVCNTRYQTAFTGYTASDGTVMGNVVSSVDFRIDNKENGAVIIAAGGADRMSVTPSLITFNVPVSFVGGGDASLLTYAASATPISALTSAPDGSIMFRVTPGGDLYADRRTGGVTVSTLIV